MKSIYICMMVLCMSIMGNCYAANSACGIEKVYVKADQIYIDDAAICVQMEDLTLPVKRLYVDDQGIYIKVAKDDRSEYWTCGVCGSRNREGKTRCWYCGELKEWGL